MIKIFSDKICVVHSHSFDPRIPGDKPLGTPVQCWLFSKYSKSQALRRAKVLHRTLTIRRQEFEKSMAQKPVIGYCMKCKAKKEIKNPKLVVKSGRKFISGVCPKCETKIFRILGKA